MGPLLDPAECGFAARAEALNKVAVALHRRGLDRDEVLGSGQDEDVIDAVQRDAAVGLARDARLLEAPSEAEHAVAGG